jgi:hypothetical protein
MINKTILKQSRQADLKAYFEQKGFELRREGCKGHYRVVGHQGLIIKDNMFCQFGTGEKGNSVDCLVNVFDLGFKEAVAELTGLPTAEVATRLDVLAEDRMVNLPPRGCDLRRVFAYLCKTRCIDKKLIVPLVKEKLLYQDERGNCVFVWMEDGEAVGAEIVGTLDRVRFKGVAENSKYARGFVIKKGNPDRAYFFESAIDLLSLMQLKEGCPELDNAFFVSMAGLKASVVEYYLCRFKVKAVLCVDNGPEGESFDKLFAGAEVIKPMRKDWNDDLKKEEKKA